jgi:hypothetical protein
VPAREQNPRTRKPPKFQRKTQTSMGGVFPPSVCAPDRRPARLLAAWHRLGCLVRGTTRPRLCTPVACTSQVLVCGVPTQGTSHWGHPLGESNAPLAQGSPPSASICRPYRIPSELNQMVDLVELVQRWGAGCGRRRSSLQVLSKLKEFLCGCRGIALRLGLDKEHRFT